MTSLTPGASPVYHTLAKIQHLADANYTPLLDKLSKEAKRLAKTELSLSGHLATFKMLLLPQILYIFWTLPIPLNSTHLNSLLTQFIWGSKRPRCSKVLLVKHRLSGGMGLVDIHDYYRASILTQLKSWLNPTPDTLWCSIEQALSPTKNLKTPLLLDAWRPISIHTTISNY